MLQDLRKVRLNNKKGVFVGDDTGCNIFQYVKEKSTGKIYGYESLIGGICELDSNGMPDKYLYPLENTEDFNKFDFGDRENPNYIPWPKGIKEPKGKRFG